MTEAAGTESAAMAATEPHRGRLRALFARSRQLVRIAYRDPENVPERLTLTAVERLAEPSSDWAGAALARRPDSGGAVLAEELRLQCASVARVDGAVAGTPFLIALVPGYLGYLWQEAQMVLRTGALLGHDPTSGHAAAELLALRGVHPSVEAAQAALDAVAGSPLPPKPAARRGLRTWLRSVRMVLVFGGFLDAPTGKDAGRRHSRLLELGSLLLAVALWVITWVFPVSFMVAMAWACERDARQLGRRAQAYYGGQTNDPQAAIELATRRTDEGHNARQIVRAVALFASLALPVAFVAYADHVRNTIGINWIGAVGAVVAVSLVIATTVVARSR